MQEKSWNLINKDIKLLFIKNNLEGFQLLTSGKIDAVGTDKWVGAFIIQKHQIKNINIVKKPFAKSIASIPVKKGNLKLLNEINNGIKKLKKDKAIRKILGKWSSKEVVFLTKERINRIITIVVTAFLIAVIVFSLLWIVLLKRQVNTKTKEMRQEIGARKQAGKELRESEQKANP
jgi:polar amino acid transport system substrate-binding protein